MQTEKHYPKQNIILAVANAFDIPEKDIFAKTRKKEIAEARQVLAYCLSRLNGMSSPSIAQILKGKDHTTVLYSIRRVERKMNLNENFKRRVQAVLDYVVNLGESKPYKKPVVDFPPMPKPEIKIEKEASGIRLPLRNLVVTEREKKIMERYREGKTLQEIAYEFNVTRERIRQIVFKVNLKEIGAKTNDGFEIDPNEYIKGEKMAHETAKMSPLHSSSDLNAYLEKAKQYTKVNLFCRDAGIPFRQLKRMFPEVLEVIEKNKEERKNRWSRNYVCCRKCGTISIPHLRHGLCEKCIGAKTWKTKQAILQQAKACSLCGMERGEAIRFFHRDLYITKDGKVLCRGCFLQATGKKLGQSRSKN